MTHQFIARALCGALLLFFSWSLIAQDPQFSQFHANRTYLNPAYAGFDAGGTLEINHRDQWFGVPDASSGPFSGGFRTSMAAFSAQFPCFMRLDGVNIGMSGVVFNDEAGIAGMKTQGAGLAVSFEVPLIGKGRGSGSKVKRLDLRGGLQNSLSQRSLADNYFLYSGQLDPVLGILNANPASSLDIGTGIYSNTKAGIMLRGMLKMKQPKKHKKKRINDQLLFTIGFAVSNVLEPDISFFEGGDPAILHRRYTFHLGWAHSLLSLRGGRNRSKYLSVSPQFRWDRQADGTLNTFTLGANFFQRTTYLGAFYTFTSPNGNGPSAASVDPVLAGGVRSLTVTSGYQFKLISRGRSMLTHQGKRETNLLISLSYDYVMGGLRTTTGGVLELGIKANLWSGAKKNCAELSKFELYKGDCPAKF